MSIICPTCNNKHQRNRIPKICSGLPKEPRGTKYIYMVDLVPFNNIEEAAKECNIEVNKYQNKLKEPNTIYKINNKTIAKFNKNVVLEHMANYKESVGL